MRCQPTLTIHFALRRARYYRCVTRDRYGTEACSAKPLPAGAIEGFVVEQMRGAVATPEMAAQVEEELLARVESLRKGLKKQRRNLRDHLRQKEQECRRISDEAGNVEGNARSLLEARATFLALDLKEAQGKSRETKQKIAALNQAEVDGKWVASMLRDFDHVWDVMSVENRGRLIHALVRTVTVDDAAETVEVELVNLAAELPECPADADPPDTTPREAVAQEAGA